MEKNKNVHSSTCLYANDYITSLKLFTIEKDDEICFNQLHLKEAFKKF